MATFVSSGLGYVFGRALFKQCMYDLRNFLWAARSGYRDTKSGGRSASPGSQHWNFHINFKKKSFIVYQKGDLVKYPIKSRDVLPKNVPGVRWGGVGCVMQGWGGVCHAGVGGVGHAGVGWVIQGWDDTYRALSPSAHCTMW